MNWSDESINDHTILKQLAELSDGDLIVKDESKIFSNRDINNNTKRKKKTYTNNTGNNSNNRNQNNRKNNNKWGRSR